VVVHVLYNNAAQNISDAQILSQIAILNADFSKTNADWSNTPAVFQTVSGNPDIQFCMAQRTPSGAATNGIVRKSTTLTSFSQNNAIKFSAQGGDDAWNTSQYLNIWVGNLGGGLLGYAQFPGGPANTDGVVCLYTAFGNTGAAAAPFNKGRTGTHEVGHWLNLYHIWGDDGTACTGSDQAGDTPNQGGPNYGTPTFPKVSCSNGPNGDMFMNYMDYVDDAAMYMFSNNQISRMQALFAAGGSRASLLTSPGCQAPTTGGSCGTPASLSATGITQTAATLNWGAVSGATSYNVSYKTSTATSFSTPVSVSGTSYSLSGLTAGTTYNWQVSATCASGTSGLASGTFTTTAANTGGCTDTYEANETRTAAKTISVNTNITAKIGSATDVDWFKFNNSSTNRNIKIDLTNLPADYDVQLYRGSTLVATSQNGGTTAEQIKYNNGSITTYYVRVYGYQGAFNASSCYTLRASLSPSAWRTINGDEVEVEQNINMDKIQSDFDASIVPNPSTGAINVSMLNLTKTDDATIRIYDVTGRLVHTSLLSVASQASGSANIQLDVPNGLYQVIISNEEMVISKKLMIQK
jgi:hypothetical protein